jgi:diguanylate cyclase (GGDEF)-like protein
MLLDLDHFKQVNDSHGHAAGDELLMQIAARLRTATRPNDTLCRLGGDEFVLLCEGLRSRAEADQLARRLLAVLQGRVQVGEHSMIPGISIGISMRDGTVEPETLLHEADRALYQAKAAGRAGIAWFSDATTATPEPERFSLDNALRDAIRTRDGLTVVYQPIIDTTSGTTVMLEALARWTHPTRGPVPPGEFVPRAEMAGVIAELDQFVLEQALGELVSRRRADEQLTVNVNVSARTLEHVGLLDRVTELLKQHHLPPSAVTFEVAETAALSPEAAASVERLQDAGCRLALDDFGSGPSSISQFIGTSADVIKIDGSLVQAAAAGNMRADMLLRLVASAAVDFDMTVVALGVQTERELALCRNAGITYAQGFLWGRS